jgi:hypothetical protein
MASKSFQEFHSSFKGTIATEDDPEYDISRWAKNTELKARYIVYPVDSQDVSKAILYATQENLDFTVKGGGHTSGSSSKGGLVIDLSKNMNEVKIDVERKLAYVQGGALTGTLKKKAFEHGEYSTIKEGFNSFWSRTLWLLWSGKFGGSMRTNALWGNR